jgi:GNAT superfamily N-acetyltransferase
MISVRLFVPYDAMTRGEQSAHMADEHDLDPEPVTPDELLAEHVVEHRAPRDHAHMTIGPAWPEDAAAIAALHEAESGRSADRQRLAEILRAYPCAVARVGDVLIGYAMSAPFGPDVLELRDIRVRQDYRGRGAGGQLLTKFEALARSSWAAVILVNSLGYEGGSLDKRLASSLYERAGYISALWTGRSHVYVKRLEQPAVRG